VCPVDVIEIFVHRRTLNPLLIVLHPLDHVEEQGILAIADIPALIGQLTIALRDLYPLRVEWCSRDSLPDHRDLGLGCCPTRLDQFPNQAINRMLTESRAPSD
jgi:hypothetical protein